MNNVINSLTQSYLILRINSTTCYHLRILADTILETSAILRCQKCTLIVTWTHLLHLCPIGWPIIRSFFFYTYFYKREYNLKFFLNFNALHHPKEAANLNIFHKLSNVSSYLKDDYCWYVLKFSHWLTIQM